MVERPVRVQLSRKKGWRMPPNTVSVARPRRFGNPFRILNEEGWPIIEGADGQCYEAPGYTDWTWSNVAQQAVDLFRLRAVDGLPSLAPLRGKNLACWCPLDQPCHADVLIELANPDAPHAR
jgi:hypothetical protein